MRQLEDSKIIDLFFERSEQAIDELSRKYGPAVKKTAANILNDRLDVEECVNDIRIAPAKTGTLPRSNPFCGISSILVFSAAENHAPLFWKV